MWRCNKELTGKDYKTLALLLIRGGEEPWKAIPDSNSVTSELKVYLIWNINLKCLVSVVTDLYKFSHRTCKVPSCNLFGSQGRSYFDKQQNVWLPVHSPASPIFHCGLFSSQFFLSKLGGGGCSNCYTFNSLPLSGLSFQNSNTLWGVPYCRIYKLICNTEIGKHFARVGKT